MLEAINECNILFAGAGEEMAIIWRCFASLLIGHCVVAVGAAQATDAITASSVRGGEIGFVHAIDGPAAVSGGLRLRLRLVRGG